MDSWKDWCRLCANLEASASSEVDENIKLTAISVFEIATSENELKMCTSCADFVQELTAFFVKTQKVNDLFEDLSFNQHLSEQEILNLREEHLYLSSEDLNPPDTEAVEATVEEIVTEEEIAEEFTEYIEMENSMQCDPDDEDSIESIEPKENYELKCDRCDKVYKMQIHFDTHLKICQSEEEPSRRYACNICSKSFKENRHLTVHMNIHLPDDQKSFFPCEQCGKKYSSVFSLRQHVKVVHVNQATFKCPHCNKAFSRKANLESHLMVHSSEKPFQCDVCHLRLKTKGNLRVHKKIHSTDPNDMVSCDVCGKQFKTSNQLTNHKITHSEEKKYSCENCDASYKRSKELQNHMMSVHFNIRRYSCPWCEKTFVNNSNYRKHKKVMHPVELEEYERLTKGPKNDEEFIVEELDEKFI